MGRNGEISHASHPFLALTTHLFSPLRREASPPKSLQIFVRSREGDMFVDEDGHRANEFYVVQPRGGVKKVAAGLRPEV